MARSLERQLVRPLAVVILVAGLVAGALSFVLAYSEAQEFQDDTLRQIASLAATGHLGSDPVHSGAAPGAERGSDAESRVLVFRAGREPHPAWLPADPPSGFHTFSADDQRFRAYVGSSGSDGRIVAAQPTDVRDEMAIDSALRTLLPLVLLLPLLVALTVRLVRREMRPVRRLAAIVDEQPAERPEPLPARGVPEEIEPFVHAINRLLERVNRLMGEQRRFVADAAHELRTPLTALSVQAQNLDRCDEPKERQERVAALQAGIERARGLTEQLLTLARTQASEVSSAQIEVSKIVRELVADYLAFAEARGVDLGLEERDAGLTLAADTATLRLVLKNGLDNALRYTPQGGEVTVRIYGQGDDVVIDVIDTGPGIPMAQRQRAFDAFHRLDGGGEGSGLGLAIAREAAVRLGGTVSLDDGPNAKGLIFRYRQGRMP